MPETWRNCGSCKKPIPYGARYWICSVSTCNRARFQLVFCSMDCWDAHVPVMNHRDAWAEQKVAPASAPPPEAARGDAPRRVLVRGQEPEREPDEVLVVASRLKAFVKEKSDFNTSADTLDALSAIIRRETEEAIRRARAAGRRTVMARDFEGE
jgi:hypothetical protein